MKTLKSTTQRDYAKRMLDVVSYIQRHLDDEITLDELADVAYFSKYHFHRIFAGMMGETLKKFIRRLRLERAALNLIKTNRSVVDIAFQAGYESHEAFTRAFKEMFAAPPQNFRKDNTSPNTMFNAKANLQKLINDNISGCEKMKEKMKVEVIEFPAVKVAYVHHTGPYNECGKAWDKLCTWAGPKGLLQPGCMFMGLSYDDPEVTPPDRIRYDACITIETDCSPEGDIQIKEVETGCYAKTTHFGPYENLSKTYNELCGQWIPAKGYVIVSKPSVEIYLNSPEDTEPDELITDVHVPLA